MHSEWGGAKLLPLGIVVLIGLVLWYIPPPNGVETQGWHLLSIFIATVIGIVLRPLPMGAVAILGLTIAVTTKILTLEDALSGFANEQIWLILTACFIARGFIKTGLGKRISYLFLYYFGKSPLGLAYGFILSDAVMAPAIPSSTARAGGVLLPILRSLAQTMGSDPEKGTARKIGSFLTMTTFNGTIISTTMFLTSGAANPIVAKFAATHGVDLTWGLWIKASIVPAVTSLILIPPLIYFLYPPELKNTHYACSHAKERLHEMGKISRYEMLMIVAFVLLLVLWIFGREFGLHATTGALLGIGFLLLTGVLTWKDLLGEEVAWDSFIWFAALVTMATFLNTFGVIGWISETIVSYVNHFEWHHALFVLILVYFFIHYFFASVTAHVSSVYAPFLAVALAVGAPPLFAALTLGFFSTLCGGLTHYGIGQAPVLYSMRYVELKTWWWMGAVMSVFYLLVWMVIGGLWWKWLGFW